MLKNNLVSVQLLTKNSNVFCRNCYFLKNQTVFLCLFAQLLLLTLFINLTLSQNHVAKHIFWFALIVVNISMTQTCNISNVCEDCFNLLDGYQMLSTEKACSSYKTTHNLPNNGCCFSFLTARKDTKALYSTSISWIIN